MKKPEGNKQALLIIKLSSLGDVLHTTPLVRTLSKHYQIYFLTFEQHKKLLENNNNIKHIFTFQHSSAFPALFHNILTLITIFFRRPKIVINLHKIYTLNFIFRIFGIKRRFGIIRKKEDRHYLAHPIVWNNHEHHIRQYLAFATLLGIGEHTYEMDFHPNPNSILDLNAYNIVKPYIVMCAGGGTNKWASMMNKRWPLDYFQTLVQLLINRGYNIVLIGGVDDLAIHKNLSKDLDTEVFDLTNKLNFSQLYLLLKGANFYLGNDSFLLHFASTTRIPTLGLFGPTAGKLLAPLGVKDSFIQAKTICSPCYEANIGLNSKAYKCGDNKCMQGIRPENVADFILCKLK